MNQNLSDIISLIIDYLNQILFLLMAFAVVVFVWYVIKYFIRPDAEKKDAGQYVMYSVIGFFVILSMWGIVNILQNTFHLGGMGQSPSYSQVQGLVPGSDSGYGMGGSSGFSGQATIHPF